MGVVGWCSKSNWSLELTGLWSLLVSGLNGPTRLLVSGAERSPELCVLGVVLFGIGAVVETSARGLCSASSMPCVRGVVGKGGLPGSKGVLDPDLKGY